MDILENYESSRSALIEIARSVFDLLDANDRFGMIKSRGIIRLDIRPATYDASKVLLDFYSAKVEAAIFAIEFDRADVIELNEQKLVTKWFHESLLLIEKHNAHICRKFLKEYSEIDHKTILSLVANYPKLSDRSHNDIATIVSKNITSIYMRSIQDEHLRQNAA